MICTIFLQKFQNFQQTRGTPPRPPLSTWASIRLSKNVTPLIILKIRFFLFYSLLAFLPSFYHWSKSSLFLLHYCTKQSINYRTVRCRISFLYSLVRCRISFLYSLVALFFFLCFLSIFILFLYMT